MATCVLVHGAYQGGWIWKPVAQRLQKAGHAVYAPTLEGGDAVGRVAGERPRAGGRLEIGEHAALGVLALAAALVNPIARLAAATLRSA